MSTMKDDMGQIKDLIKAEKNTNATPVDLETMQKMIRNEIKQLNKPVEASATHMHAALHRIMCCWVRWRLELV